MKKLTILLLVTVLLFQSCENKTQQQNNTSKSQIVGKKDTIIDTIKNIVKPIKSSHLLFNIEGNYTLKQDIVEQKTDCKIFLSLFYKNGVLRYDLETNTRKLSGNAEIELNEKKDGYYITFKDIKWSEYLGEIDNEGKASEEDIPLPQDIQGVLYKDEITIQNTGNAMNYYVKLGECDLKYIHLVK